ncbi:DUF6201 family protein [Neisseriaceae bacterium ESL0693]|nr:DUF6201 family protein [Neisseriaceae bacterium ESL0693]
MIRNYFQRISKTKPYKIIRRIFWILFLLWWLLLSHVTFSVPPWKNNTTYACSFDKYHIIAESPLPINPAGIWLNLRYFSEYPYYMVVYDNQGHYIGQNRAALHSDIYNGIRNKINVCHGLEIRDGALTVLSDDDDVDVPLNHKRWWSWVLQFIHLLVPDWILRIPLLVQDHMLQLMLLFLLIKVLKSIPLSRKR